MKTNYNLSFCVVSMNRLHQLKETLPKNIKDNESYKNLEFIVLDYNSEDGMEQWMKENMKDYIKSGRVTYYKTTEPTSWNPSHSKNIVFKLAKGDIVCNIWADYYTGLNFADYVNNEFDRDNNIVLTPIDFPKTKKNYFPPGDVLGKVCVNKNDFTKIKGFDERMNQHGYEDYDFINRLEMIGVKRKLIEDFKFLEYVWHDNAERYLLPIDNLYAVFISYSSPSRSTILFLYKDHTFEKGVLIDNLAKNSANYVYAYKLQEEHFLYSIEAPGWESGLWVQNTDIIRLTTSTNNEYVFKHTSESDFMKLTDVNNEMTFHQLVDHEEIVGVMEFKRFTYTRIIMEKNLKDKAPIVNSKNFGKATLYKNFQSEVIFV